MGNETDTTIADYVADLRAPTPSAAAELAVYDVRLLLEQLEDYKGYLVRGMNDRIGMTRERMALLERQIKFYHPSNQILQTRQYLAELSDRLSRQMQPMVQQKRHDLQILSERLDGMAPLKRLESGYAYVEGENEQRVDSIEKVKPEDTIQVVLWDGKIKAHVVATEKNQVLKGENR